MKVRRAAFAAVCVIAIMQGAALLGQTSRPSIFDVDGAVHVPAMTVPASSLSSGEARANLAALANSSIPTTRRPTRDEIAAVQREDAAFFKTWTATKAATSGVTVTATLIGGVNTDVFAPRGGVPGRNRDRVLINLHGGGFFRGWRNYSVLESVPVSAKGGFKVVSVDYREAPDHHFPAASEDVAAVYKALLKRYKPQNIGIYGCSAGGILTFEALAWFQVHGLPRPGAIGIMGAGGMAEVTGDSLFTAQALSGRALPQDAVPHRGLDLLNLYFDAGSARDAAQSPAYYPDILRKFPPSLILNATRDLTMSDAVFTHRALVKAGASSELHIWDGVGHCFEYDARLPESQEAHQLLIQFFDQHLGR